MPAYTIYATSDGAINRLITCPDFEIEAQLGAGEDYIAGSYDPAYYYIDITQTPPAPALSGDSPPDGDPSSPAGWHHGAGAPSDALGADGEYYLNDSNGDYYQKAGGSWGSPIGNLAGLSAHMTRTSTDSVTIGSGNKSFTYSASGNLGWVVGMRLRAAKDAYTWMEGPITAVSSTSVTINVDTLEGSGTYASWALGVAGQPGSGGEGSALARGEVSLTTGSLADNATETGTVGLGKSFLLLKVSADRACRVRLYETAGYRTADAARPVGSDPVGEHGLIADLVFTASNLSLDLAPTVTGVNLEEPPSASIAYAVQNRSGATSTVQLTFIRIPLE
jgi:hypothetical protein